MRLEICLYLLYREHTRDSKDRHADRDKDEREDRRTEHKDARLDATVRQI